jgi:ribonuclease D
MDSQTEEDKKYKSLAFPLITDINSANKILEDILQNEHAVIGLDTEAAVEMSRFGILCLLQVINTIKIILMLIYIL